MTKFALFTYNTGNIGDDIQSIAARRFLPKVDYMINRDFINEFKSETNEKIKLIMNGWYSHQPENFPVTNESIDPLLISMYIDDSVKSHFASNANKEFFEKHGPVGARSLDTQKYLQETVGVESYLSSCMTLTLKPEKGIKKQNFILAIDLPNEAFDALVKRTSIPVIRMSADVTHRYMTAEGRLRVAEYYLFLYQSAKFVVTTRLHATLPCLALGTPVLNLQVTGFEEQRFAGLRELAHHMTVEEFIGGGGELSDILKKNPETFKPIAKELEQRCLAFTGYNNKQGFLHGSSINNLLSDSDLIQSVVTGLWTSQQHWGVIKYK